MTSIAFIGGGNMARSIIGGLIATGYDPETISVSDPNQSQRELLQEKFGVHCFGINADAISDCEVVVLAVKPQYLREVVEEIGSVLKPDSQLLVSIAAGIRTVDILRWVGQDMPFIRVMPNTPALVKIGACGMLANGMVSDRQKDLAQGIFNAIGKSVWVESEQDIDTVTGISGSGPAYFFKVMEVMIDSAMDNGLDRKTATTLVLQTALGAAHLASESEHPPAELRRQVTSPNGTTEAALNAMEDANIEQAVRSGIEAAIKRSDELARESGDQ